MVSDKERYNPWLDLDNQLFFIAQHIKDGTPPFFSEILKKKGEWKYLAFSRYLTSLALAKSPNVYFNQDEALEWLQGDDLRNPLLAEEIPPIQKDKLVLPYPYPYVNLDVATVGDIPGIGRIPICPTPGDPAVNAWYEPSINWGIWRFADQLSVPGKLVGVTSGKWRFIHSAHMHSLWEMRQKCDFMTVGVDPVEYDRATVKDGFIPEYQDKVNFLHAITFPDGRKIDLIFPTHGIISAENWYKSVFLPVVMYSTTEELETFKMEEVEAALRIFSHLPEYVLGRVRETMSPRVRDKAERLRYFVSEADPHLEHKKLSAARVGVEVFKLSSPPWKQAISASKIVEKFGLGNLPRTKD